MRTVLVSPIGTRAGSAARTVRSLVRNDARARARGSVLGRHWSILWPLAETAFFAVLFGALLRVRGTTADYLPFVLVGVFSWRVFARTVTAAAGSVQTHRPLLSSFPVRIRHVVLASMATTLREAAPGLLVVVSAVLLLVGAPPPNSLVWLVPGLVLFLATTAGLALLAAIGGALARDVQRGLGPLMTLLMFAAPVVYPPSLVPDSWRGLFLASPMAASLTTLRTALIGGAPPPAGSLLAAAAAAAGLLVAGWWVAMRAEERVREAVS